MLPTINRIKALDLLDRESVLIRIAAVGGLVAAATHFVVTPEHLAEYRPYGIVLLCIGVAQSLSTLVLLSGSLARKIVVAIGLFNLGVAALWTLTRTIGVPIGPARGFVEPADALGVIATAAELCIALACFRFADRSSVAHVETKNRIAS